jgi:hypothetical protein
MPRTKGEVIRMAPEADLERLVQQKVAEALADRSAILEPWFQTSRALAAAIRRHQSIFHKRKFALYFEKWGCLVCGTKEQAHESHGMCNTCHFRFLQRLHALEKEYAKTHPQEYENQQIESLTSRIRNAERLLRVGRPMGPKADE